MRNTLAAVLLSLACTPWAVFGAAAATTDLTEIWGALTRPSGLAAIAFEAPGCRYCTVFRRDIVPTYASTPSGKKAPLHFVDLNDPSAKAYQLSSPITIVPTVVLVKDGVEIGRIGGYFGRQNFHRMLETLLQRH